MTDREIIWLPVELEESKLGYKVDKYPLIYLRTNNEKDISDIYFETVSGNIYWINKTGQIADLDRSRRNGRLSVEQLVTVILEKSVLKIGERFYYSRPTNEIMQIVAVDSMKYDPKKLIQITNGRKSEVFSKFQEKIKNLSGK